MFRRIWISQLLLCIVINSIYASITIDVPNEVHVDVQERSSSSLDSSRVTNATIIRNIVHSSELDGMAGSFQVTLIGGWYDANMDTYGRFDWISSETADLPGEQGHSHQHCDTVLLLSFDLSNATIHGTLVFSVRATNELDIYQRIGDKTAELVHSCRSNRCENVVVNRSARSPIVEFAIVNRDRNPLQAEQLYIDVVSNEEYKDFSVKTQRKMKSTRKLEFFTLFTDNMMLQRDTNVAVYGAAEPGTDLIVSLADQTSKTTADQNGFWITHLDPMPASYSPRTLSVTDGESTITLQNVLVGDIWLAGGQSNMDRAIEYFVTLNVKGIHNPHIRLVDVLENDRREPTDSMFLNPSLDASWQECKTEYLEKFSPAAYYFADKLEQELQVPVGILLSATGATKIERWLARDTLIDIGFPAPDTDEASLGYNGMIYPLRLFTFKGILWYQGESNVMDTDMDYSILLTALIKSWRTLFGRQDLPFYYAQLASIGPSPRDETDSAMAFFREAQEKALKLPYTAMIVLTDAGEYEAVHPQDKMSVGERFARHALVAEGIEGVNVDNPTFSDMTIIGSKVLLTFDNIGGGLETREVRMNRQIDLPPGKDKQAFVAPADELLGFEIAGPNKIFVQANASITSSDQVTVWSEHVTNPIAVRYCFKWFGLCNLYASNDGLIARPFRTDKFAPPNFSGYTSGVLFNGNFQSLGDPMEASVAAGSSKVKSVTVKGVNAYQVTGPSNSVRQIYFSANNTDELLNEPYIVVQILYFDKGHNAEISIRYDGKDSESSSIEGPIKVKLESTFTWRVANAVLRDAAFRQSFAGSDLRIQADKVDMIIGGVFLSSVPPSNPTSSPRLTAAFPTATTAPTPPSKPHSNSKENQVTFPPDSHPIVDIGITLALDSAQTTPRKRSHNPDNHV